MWEEGARGEVAARLDGAPEVGRRGIGDLGLREFHRDAVDAHRRGSLCIGVNDDVFGRVDARVVMEKWASSAMASTGVPAAPEIVRNASAHVSVTLVSRE